MLLIEIVKVNFKQLQSVIGQMNQFINYLSNYIYNFDSIGFIYFNTPNNIQPGLCFNIYSFATSDANNNLVLKEQWTDEILYMTHYKYQQTYKGINVEAAEYTEHFQNNTLIFSNGKFADDLTCDINPKISEQEALRILLASMSPEYFYAWESEEWELNIKIDLNDNNATFYPDGELLLALDNYKALGFNIPVSRYTLSWSFDIVCLNPSFHKKFYVDANSGNIFREDQLRHNDGTATIWYHGTQTIDTQWYGGFVQKYILESNDNGRFVHTKYYSTSAWGMVNNVKNPDNNWGTNHHGATAPHWFACESWDFFENTYGWTGMDNNSAQVRVQADRDNFNDAHFDPSGGMNYLCFGKSGSIFYGRAIDVVGHEFTHGVSYYKPDFNFSYESGALCESFSDIFGFMIEQYAEGGVSDWIYGEESGGTTRSYSNPKSDGYHYIDSQCNKATGQPDTYNGSYWYSGSACDNGGVHVNSGVQNYWFYLLSVGGNGTNDNGDNYSIQGIGIDDAAEIAFWNLTNIMQSGSQYEDARRGAITSATLLFGNCSNQEIQTTNAWHAVGVGSTSPCVGIEEYIINGLISVFPNPVSNTLTVSFSNNEEYGITIYSIEGRLIKELKNVVGTKKINFSNIPNGIYIIKIKNNKVSLTKKLIKYE